MRKSSVFFISLVLIGGLYFTNAGFVSADFLNQTVIFNINSDYDYLGRSQVSATLRKISDKAYWYIGDDYWNNLSESERNFFLQRIDELAQEFDSRIYPIETNFWGTEPNPGIDNDPRTTILITRLVDFAGGYFESTHLYRKSHAPDSNEREMFFLNSNAILNERTKIFSAHEFQHLIAFYQKDVLKGASEEVWLNEARAEYAPRLLGYDDIFEISNIRRRIIAFQQSPSEPLGEWKNQQSDYGSITLFTYYLADTYGDRILLDTLRSSKTGIESINEFLSLNGFKENFSDVFSNWTITNILNDSAVDSKFAYKSVHLANFRISSTQSFSISGSQSLVSISSSVKDWQPVWYEFNTPINSGTGLNLKIEFSSDFGTKFRVPYIAYKINGQKEIGFVPISGSTSSPQVSGSNGTLFLKNFGSDFYKVVLIPANHSKVSGFTDNDPTALFSLRVQSTAEFQEITPTPTPEPSPAFSIQDLLKQIALLQEQLNKLKEKAQPFPLTRNLFAGSRGDDVKWLQDFLVKQGVYQEAKTTGYFGSLTRAAAIRFQQKYGIFPQIGYVGVKTRAKIAELAQ
ncbi:MAG: peptidoglycan-binding protein [Patescibacteria group bacterium]